jgi:hypothetical protein
MLAAMAPNRVTSVLRIDGGVFPGMWTDLFAAAPPGHRISSARPCTAHPGLNDDPDGNHFAHTFSFARAKESGGVARPIQVGIRGSGPGTWVLRPDPSGIVWKGWWRSSKRRFTSSSIGMGPTPLPPRVVAL